MIWQEMSDIYPKEESTGCLIARHMEDEFFVLDGTSNGSDSLMVVFYIQRDFQRHPTHPNPSSNEEVMSSTIWRRKQVS